MLHLCFLYCDTSGGKKCNQQKTSPPTLSVSDGFLLASYLYARLVPPQPVPVQRREHDGPLQPGHLLRPHADAHAWQPGPGLLPGTRQRDRQDHHHPPRDHLPRRQRAGRARLREVHGWRRLLVRQTHWWFQQSCRPLGKSAKTMQKFVFRQKSTCHDEKTDLRWRFKRSYQSHIHTSTHSEMLLCQTPRQCTMQVQEMLKAELSTKYQIKIYQNIQAGNSVSAYPTQFETYHGGQCKGHRAVKLELVNVQMRSQEGTAQMWGEWDAGCGNGGGGVKKLDSWWFSHSILYSKRGKPATKPSVSHLGTHSALQVCALCQSVSSELAGIIGVITLTGELSVA